MTESRTLAIEGKRYFHTYNLKAIDPSLNLLAFLNSQKSSPKCYWQEGEKEIIAFGNLLTLNTVPVFDRDNDSPVRFWGGHAFFRYAEPRDTIWSSFPKSSFFIPQYEIIRTRERTLLLSQSLNGPIQELEINPSDFEESKGKVEERAHMPTKENWDTLIQAALLKISPSILDKVVLARRTTHEGSCNPFALLSKLRSERSIRFALQFSPDKTFIGATPERLYQRQEDQIYTEAIAGTRPIGEARFEQELMENPKEQREFNLVKETLFECLSRLCDRVECSDTSIIKTAYVQHLYCALHGQLKENFSDAHILALLHPTPATGGLPKMSALEHLMLYESFDRGWYAAPFGYVSQERAEFAVCIRSALVEKERVHLFAGAGIVEGSIPEAEWQELDYKMEQWKHLL